MAIAFVTPEQGEQLTDIEALHQQGDRAEDIDGFQAYVPRPRKEDPKEFKTPTKVFGRRTKKYSNRL